VREHVFVSELGVVPSSLEGVGACGAPHKAGVH
jgi:hypothetical protein